VPVTRIVFPFFTQVIVFFLLDGLADGLENIERDGDGEGDGEALAEGELLGDGDSLAIGELDGLGLALTISAALAVAEGVGVALAVTTGIGFGVKSGSYATFPSAFLTLVGKFSGNGVSDKCFITERTSGRKFGNTFEAPSAVMPALRVRISVNRLR
jgi:hypothetical protein